MFNTPVEAMRYSLRISRLMLHRLVDDLKASEFEFQPSEGANCIAWIIGHLTLTDRRQLAWLGCTDLPELPEDFEPRFKVTRTKAEKQNGYGDPRALIALFDAHRDLLIAQLDRVDPSTWMEPPSFQTPMFADRGEAALFMGLHTSMHVGQISSIRRVLGYPPLA